MKSKAPLLAAFCVVLTRASSPASPPVERLEREFARIARALPGTVGIAAVHVESGAIARWNAGGRFPMASTYKVPIAVQVLYLVDEGQVRLDRMIEIRQGDLHPGSGTLSRLFEGVDAPGGAGTGGVRRNAADMVNT